METKNKTVLKFEKKPVVLFLSCAVFFLLIGILAFNFYNAKKLNSSKPAVAILKESVKRNASMWLEPENISVSKNKTFELTIFVDGGGEVINGVDVVMTYNEKLLKVEKIAENTDLLIFPRKKAEKGKIFLTGIKVEADKNPFTTISLATVTFKSLQSGQTTILFEHEAGKTNASTVIKAGTSDNILGKIKNNAIVNID